MSKVAYFDCISGASGDMILGALVDAGLEFAALERELAGLALPQGSYSLAASRTQRAGLAATKVDVNVSEAPRHRSLDDVFAVIEKSRLPASDRSAARSVFQALGEAEAQVHGTDVRNVELHEVGSVDALVDVFGAICGLRLLGVEHVFASPLPLGHGTVKARHGSLPVPAPATLNLLAAKQVPVVGGEGPAMELVTPTGAALLAVLADFQRPEMRLEATGLGAGGRDPEAFPNVLRVWLGASTAPSLPRMRVMETNIDDMSPELLGFVQERLLAAGAADVWFTAIQMKKNRPAVMLSAIVRQDLEAEIANIMLKETSTLGVRVRTVERYEADREVRNVETSLGPVRVKLKSVAGQIAGAAPEYDDCRKIALDQNLPLAEVYRRVRDEAERLLASE